MTSLLFEPQYLLAALQCLHAVATLLMGSALTAAVTAARNPIVYPIVFLFVAFLMSGLVFHLVVEHRYRNIDKQSDYASETSIETCNSLKRDQFNCLMYGLSSPYIDGHGKKMIKIILNTNSSVLDKPQGGRRELGQVAAATYLPHYSAPAATAQWQHGHAQAAAVAQLQHGHAQAAASARPPYRQPASTPGRAVSPKPPHEHG